MFRPSACQLSAVVSFRLLMLRSGTAYQMMSPPLLSPVNLSAPFEDILIPLLLQHSLILLYLLWLSWSSWWRCCLGHSKNTMWWWWWWWCAYKLNVIFTDISCCLCVRHADAVQCLCFNPIVHSLVSCTWSDIGELVLCVFSTGNAYPRVHSIVLFVCCILYSVLILCLFE